MDRLPQKLIMMEKCKATNGSKQQYEVPFMLSNNEAGPNERLTASILTDVRICKEVFAAVHMYGPTAMKQLQKYIVTHTLTFLSHLLNILRHLNFK